MKSCYNCKYFTPIDEEGECSIYFIPNHDVGECSDWKMLEEEE